MSINTRSKKRELVNAFAEYSIEQSAKKGVSLNLPKEALTSNTGEAAFIKSSLLDISVIGCAIDSSYLIPPGIILNLRIDPKPFAVEGIKERKESLQITGKVTSCVMKAAGHYRLGVKFSNIRKEDLELIDTFINAKERRKAPRWDMTKGV
ncbi:MAG: PilZ domain-containing protein [Candidatus Omnitrophica bacterium]|nr:PilZ domain-containing protein [Candidatus Omnitrophota bacterium]